MTRVRAALLAATLLVSLVAGVYTYSALPTADAPPAVQVGQTPAAAPKVLRPNASIALPAEPGALLPLGSAIWITQPRGLVRVAIQSERVTQRVRLPVTPYDLVAANGSLWVVGMVAGERRVTREGNYPVINVARVDPASGRVLARIPIPAKSNGNRLAYTGARLWVSDPAEGASSRIFTIDPATHRVATLGGGQEPVALIPDGTRIWTANHDDGTLRAHHPRTGRTTASTRLPGEPHGLAVASGWLWVADAHNNRILQIDPDSLRIVRRIPLGQETGPLAPAERGGVWATGRWHPPSPTRLRRIDTSGQIVQSVVTADPIIAFLSSHKSLWIAVTGQNRLLRITE